MPTVEEKSLAFTDATSKAHSKLMINYLKLRNQFQADKITSAEFCEKCKDLLSEANEKHLEQVDLLMS